MRYIATFLGLSKIHVQNLDQILASKSETKLPLQNPDKTLPSKFGPNFSNWFGLVRICEVRQEEVA